MTKNSIPLPSHEQGTVITLYIIRIYKAIRKRGLQAIPTRENRESNSPKSGN